eukprot:121768-Chlamydomonas_euryale.AAC.3
MELFGTACACMGWHGSAQGLHKVVWDCVCMHRRAWVCMEPAWCRSGPRVHAWDGMGLRGACMEPFGTACACMERHGSAWSLHGAVRDRMCIHGMAWVCMEPAWCRSGPRVHAWNGMGVHGACVKPFGTVTGVRTGSA